ncbi:MAG: amino acid racemase [Candidatus Bathyarchaeota archaeon]|nr:amino acid racemase [Candidatus Bathyarchaeota archaeon]
MSARFIQWLGMRLKDNGMKAKHIGIVACSAEGAALCYRTICIESEKLMGRQTHPEVTLHTHPLSEYMQHIETGDWAGVANLMLSSANKLARAGADFTICPDNTIHQAFDLVIKKSPIPWLHIAEEVAVEAKLRGHRYLGILGTRYLMESSVYPDKLSIVDIKNRIPEVEQREHINNIIFTELVRGILSSNTREYLCKIIAEFKQYECDAVVLGCTEIPLLISQKDSTLPVLDSTRILARAALKKSINTKH